MSLSIQRDALDSKYLYLRLAFPRDAWFDLRGNHSSGIPLLWTAVSAVLSPMIMERIVMETEGTGDESHQL